MIEITKESAQKIIIGLSQFPYKEVVEIIDSIKAQLTKEESQDETTQNPS